MSSHVAPSPNTIVPPRQAPVRALGQNAGAPAPTGSLLQPSTSEGRKPAGIVGMKRPAPRLIASAAAPARPPAAPMPKPAALHPQAAAPAKPAPSQTGSSLQGVSPQPKIDRAPSPQVPGPAGKSASPETSPGLPFDPDRIRAGARQIVKILHQKYPAFDANGQRVILGEDMEKLARYEHLDRTLDSPELSEKLEKQVSPHRNDAMYKHMGPTKFASLLDSSNRNLELSRVPTYGLTDLERVALYGYTTGDHKDIDPALRNGSAEAGVLAYARHVLSAMKKLPDQRPAPGQNAVLYRAINSRPEGNGWARAAFEKGKTYTETAFGWASTATPPAGEWNLTIQGMKHTKDVGPYSGNSAEKAILTLPGTRYTVADVDGSRVMLVPQ